MGLCSIPSHSTLGRFYTMFFLNSHRLNCGPDCTLICNRYMLNTGKLQRFWHVKRGSDIYGIDAKSARKYFTTKPSAYAFGF